MNYYLDEATNEVYGYDDEQVEQGYVKSGLVPITEEQVHEINAKKAEEYKNSDEYKEMMRGYQAQEKKDLMSHVDSEIDNLEFEIEDDIAEDWAEDYLKDLKRYKSKLRRVDTDIVPCEFPEFPKEPS